MQEVIIYRNPVEAAIWNALFTPGGILIFIAVIVAALVGVWVYDTIQNWRSRSPLALMIRSHNGKLSIAVTIALLYGAHRFFFT